MKTAEELKKAFMNDWGKELWDYFEKTANFDKTDIAMRIELDELLKQHAIEFGKFIHRTNAKAIKNGLDSIKALPESINAWYKLFNSNK